MTRYACGIISLLIPLQKLEASRDDFYNDLLKTRDVDCVLSTLEILDILKDKNIDFISLEEAPLEHLYVILFWCTELTPVRFTNESGGKLFGTHGGSGGYLDYIFRYAAKELYNTEVTGDLNYTIVRNSDYKEVSLEVRNASLCPY